MRVIFRAATAAVVCFRKVQKNGFRQMRLQNRNNWPVMMIFAFYWFIIGKLINYLQRTFTQTLTVIIL